MGHREEPRTLDSIRNIKWTSFNSNPVFQKEEIEELEEKKERQYFAGIRQISHIKKKKGGEKKSKHKTQEQLETEDEASYEETRH